MPELSSFNDYGPITWIRRKPVYLTTILTVLFVAGMFLTVILATARLPVDQIFAFTAYSFWHGSVWQVVTYPLLAMPNFFYIFTIFFFYWFGVDVERYLGRSRYAQLFALLLVTPALMLTLWWKFAGVGLYPIDGSMIIAVGFFVAFATLYPNLEYWGWITMKWLVFAGIVLDCMMYLPSHDWIGLSVLLATCAAAFAFIKLLQRGIAFEIPAVVGNIFKRRPKFKVVPKEEGGDDVCESIDPLLDKISKHGIGSLTARERKQLERARESLLKKPD